METWQSNKLKEMAGQRNRQRGTADDNNRRRGCKAAEATADLERTFSALLEDHERVRNNCPHRAQMGPAVGAYRSPRTISSMLLTSAANPIYRH
ncbi:hypothetical protein Ddc_06861 [Ditylenchus destructor]|nr:hypothetical protein Ddc_06861 [Ditylenchus destructor]